MIMDSTDEKYIHFNGRYHPEDLSVFGRIILKWILKNYVVRVDKTGSG
jgi:hypothetical protein